MLHITNAMGPAAEGCLEDCLVLEDVLDVSANANADSSNVAHEDWTGVDVVSRSYLTYYPVAHWRTSGC